jgi:hypothetical protein
MRAVVLNCADESVTTGYEVLDVGPRPGKDLVDPVLDHDRIAVLGTDADFAAVVLRLLRKEKLGSVALARRVSALAGGTPEPTTLVRDDNGGVLVGEGTLTDVDGVVYGDSTKLLDGRARRITVRPDPAGVAVTVRRGRFGRAHRSTARAVQFGVHPTKPFSDGVEHPREVERWAWYRHVQDLLILR